MSVPEVHFQKSWTLIPQVYFQINMILAVFFWFALHFETRYLFQKQIFFYLEKGLREDGVVKGC